MDSYDNNCFNNALSYVKTSSKFVVEEGRISCHYVSGLAVFLLLLLSLAVLAVLVYYNRKYKYIDINESLILLPIMYAFGSLLIAIVQTNKVIDYKDNSIYCELLIFNSFILRYHVIKGENIVEVANNTKPIHSKKNGFHYIYFTSFLLKDGTINNFFELNENYKTAYNLVIVAAKYLNKPFLITGNSQQLTVSSGERGLRLSTIQLNIEEFEYNHQIKAVLMMAIIIFVMVLLLSLSK